MTSARRRSPLLILLLVILLAALAGAGLSPRPLSAAAPTVTSIFPSSGPSGGGTVVTITGTGFQSPAVTGVTFLAPAASFVVIDDNTITATTPFLGSAGTVTVAVTNTDGTNPNDGLNNFTYIQASVLVIESAGATAVTEGGLTDTYSLLPTTAPSGTVTISIPDTAQLDITPNILTFTPGDWTFAKIVLVTAINDVVNEGTHFSSITQTASGGGFDGIVIPSVLVTITDNDQIELVVVESGGATAVGEGGAMDTFTVALEGPPVGSATVLLTVGAQVSATSAPLTFTAADWNIPKTVTVSAVDDGVIEGNHAGSVTLTLTGGGFGAVTPKIVNVTITDNDSRQVIVSAGGGGTRIFTAIDDTYISRQSRNANFGANNDFTVDEEPRRDGLLRFSVNGLNGLPIARATLRLYVTDPSNSGGQVFRTTFSNWVEETVTWNTAPDFSGGAIAQAGAVSDNTWQEFDLTSVVTGDGIVSLRLRSFSENRVDYATKESSATFAPQLVLELAGGADPSLSEGGPAAVYTVVLNSQPVGTTTVSVTPDAELTASPRTLFFSAANWNLPQTVTLLAVDDDDIEGAHSGTVTHNASGGGYDGVAVPSVVAQILDNDAAGVLIAQSAGATAVGEDGLTDTYTIVLTSRPATAVTITITPDDDLTVSPASVRFTTADWDRPQTITVQAVDDDAVEGDETGRITHSASGGAFSGENDRIVVIQLPRGLELVGWFGEPTTSHALIESNRFILRIWGWDSVLVRWVVDDPLLPSGLRSNFTITRGRGFFVVTSAPTELEVPIS